MSDSDAKFFWLQINEVEQKLNKCIVKSETTSNDLFQDIHGTIHEEQDRLNDDFIQDIAKGTYTIEEIRFIAKKLSDLSKIDYIKYWC